MLVRAPKCVKGRGATGGKYQCHPLRRDNVGYHLHLYMQLTPDSTPPKPKR